MASVTTNDLTEPEPDASVPRHTLNVWTGYTWQNGLGVNVGVRYLGRTFADNGNTFTIDGYGVLNLALHYHRGVFHVAVDPADQRVLGFQSMEPFASYTHGFDHVGVLGTYVDLGSRRHGIATALFEATFEAARRKGYEKLFTFVRADNPAALATYLKQAFCIVGTARRHAKINGVYVDEIIIERFL